MALTAQVDMTVCLTGFYDSVGVILTYTGFFSHIILILLMASRALVLLRPGASQSLKCLKLLRALWLAGSNI